MTVAALQTAYEKAAAGGRLTHAEGALLLEEGDTHILGALAHKRRMALHPERARA